MRGRNDGSRLDFLFHFLPSSPHRSCLNAAVCVATTGVSRARTGTGTTDDDDEHARDEGDDELEVGSARCERRGRMDSIRDLI